MLTGPQEGDLLLVEEVAEGIHGGNLKLLVPVKHLDRDWVHPVVHGVGLLLDLEAPEVVLQPGHLLKLTEEAVAALAAGDDCLLREQRLLEVGDVRLDDLSQNGLLRGVCLHVLRDCRHVDAEVVVLLQ
jgi:hypothetical protein